MLRVTEPKPRIPEERGAIGRPTQRPQHAISQTHARRAPPGFAHARQTSILSFEGTVKTVAAEFERIGGGVEKTLVVDVCSTKVLRQPPCQNRAPSCRPGIAVGWANGEDIGAYCPTLHHDLNNVPGQSAMPSRMSPCDMAMQDEARRIVLSSAISWCVVCCAVLCCVMSCRVVSGLVRSCVLV